MSPPLPSRLNTYHDVIPILDDALRLGGVEVSFSTPGQAINFRQRCYAFRKAFAKENKLSEYDKLILPSLDKGQTTVRVIFRVSKALNVKPLGVPSAEKVAVATDEDLDDLELELRDE